MKETEAYCARCLLVMPKAEMERRATGEEGAKGTNHWFLCLEPCDEFKARQRAKAKLPGVRGSD